MRVAFGTDETTALTDAMQAHLTAAGHEVVLVAADHPWPEVGHAVGRAVAAGDVDCGVVCCWTGTGVSIAANKVPGVRAALCTDAETARGARRWNDANVLAVGLRLTSAMVAAELLDAFCSTAPDADEADAIGRVEAAGGRPDPSAQAGGAG
ncbi:MAG: RpiB/LacA/LacB family sugar-phosphate isomerase [Acidimicrobiales bacterium]